MYNKRLVFSITLLAGFLLLTSCAKKDDGVKTGPTLQSAASVESSASDQPSATPSPTPFVLPSNVNFVIEPKFDDAKPFNAFGYAIVGVNTNGVVKYGMINESGTFVIEPEYDAYSYPEQMKYTRPEADIGYTWLQKDGLWGFVNEKCEWVVECKYENCLFFTDIGFSGVEVDGKWGFISTSGKMVVEPMYDAVNMCYGSEYAAVCKNELWGLIDREGKVVLEPSVTDLITDGDCVEFGYWSSAGYDVVLVNNYSGLMSLDGKMLIENSEDWIESISSNGLVFADSPTDGTGYFNMKGDLVIALQENERGYMFADNGLAIVETQAEDGSKTCRYINAAGKTVIEGPFEQANDFAPDGIASVVAGGSLGFIDMTGAYVVEPQFDTEWSLRFDANGYTPVVKDGKWAIMDDTGKLNTDYIYDDCSWSIFDELPVSVFAVSQDGKWGLIDAFGKSVLEPQFDSIIISSTIPTQILPCRIKTENTGSFHFRVKSYSLLKLKMKVILWYPKTAILQF